MSEPRDGAIIGVSDHGGWAVLVTVAGDGTLLDRRRVELVDQGLPKPPHHHEAQTLPLEKLGLDAVAADARGWAVQWYDARKVLDAACDALHVEDLDAHFLEVRRSVGPLWNKDHKLAMAAAIVAAKARPSIR